MHIEFGSDLDTNSNELYLAKDIINKDIFKDIYTFQNCRSALNLIAKLLNKVGYKTIFMPSICCHSMVQPFKYNNFEIIYYPLYRDFSIDIDFIIPKLNEKSIILYSNYLGLKELNAIEVEKKNLNILKSKYNSLKIIQDCTQSISEMLYREDIYADYLVCSIRKWASFPDGGILFSNEKLNFQYDTYDDTVFNYKKEAMDLKSNYLNSKNSAYKIKFLELFKKAEQIIDTDNSIIDMSSYSKSLLYRLDFKAILQSRHSNINYIKNFIPSYGFSSLGSGLYFPILVSNAKLLQSELAKRSIYCPVIWPISEEVKEKFNFSSNLTSHMLAIPCDQRYSNKEDLDYIIENLLEALTITGANLITLSSI